MMKTYGANKSTEFSRKQIGCLYHNAKDGKLNIERWMMNRLYDLADYYGFDDNHSVEREESTILNIIETMFSGDLEETQNLINDYTESTFQLLGRKAQNNANRDLVK